MKTALFTNNLNKLKTDALVIGLYEDGNDFDKYNNLSEGLLSDIVEEKEFTGKFGKLIILRLKGNIKRLVFVGLGKKEEFNFNKAREAAGKAAVYVRDNDIKEFSFLLFDNLKPYDSAYCIVEGIKLSLYHFVNLKTQNLEEIKRINEFSIVADKENYNEVDKAIKMALIITDSVCYARDLQNNPSNVATPTYLAEEARKIAKNNKLKCTILEKRDMERLGMGGILAVNKGSAHPPKFIVLEYTGGKETICFVGKGVTFDSGGISIKPSDKMWEMKFDMSGGAVVLGIMQAVSKLRLPFRIIGIVPTTENLPSGSACKPGDVIKMMNGKTVEIIDTDAEGRLILADALAYTKKFNPKKVIDFATLTGACHIALGDVCSGLFSNDDDLSKDIFEAGEKSGERVWRFPIYEDYKENIKSKVADIKNHNESSYGGAINAAMFLKEFVDCKSWAHLDLAGTAYITEEKYVLKPTGGTGIGIRLAIQLLENWSN